VSVTSSLFSKKFAICCRAMTCFSRVLRRRVENWCATTWVSLRRSRSRAARSDEASQATPPRQHEAVTKASRRLLNRRRTQTPAKRLKDVTHGIEGPDGCEFVILRGTRHSGCPGSPISDRVEPSHGP